MTAISAGAVEFALQELIACWDQSYEALLRGDLDRVQALLEVADDHVATASHDVVDSPAAAQLRLAAATSRGRLEHGMRKGKQGVQDELAQTRVGAKVLRGYGNPALGLGNSVSRDC